MTIIKAEDYKAAHDRIYGPYGVEIEWKDREGHVWKVSEMADDHLENSMAMMIRNAVGIHDRECYRMAEAGDDPIIGPHGDAANDAFDDEFRQLMDMDPEKYIKTSYPPYQAMKAVLDERKRLMDQRIKDMRSITDDWTGLREFQREHPEEGHDDAQHVRQVVLEIARHISNELVEYNGIELMEADDLAQVVEPILARYFLHDEEYEGIVVADWRTPDEPNVTRTDAIDGGEIVVPEPVETGRPCVRCGTRLPNYAHGNQKYCHECGVYMNTLKGRAELHSTGITDEESEALLNDLQERDHQFGHE